MKKQSEAGQFWIEYASTLWALVFAALHIAWAAGWYLGLDAEKARNAFESKWFLAYDLIAAALCLIAAALALTFAGHWGQRLPRSLVNGFGWCCALVLTLRGSAAIIQAIYLGAGGNGSTSFVLLFWDWWFCLTQFCSPQACVGLIQDSVGIG